MKLKDGNKNLFHFFPYSFHRTLRVEEKINKLNLCQFRLNFILFDNALAFPAVYSIQHQLL